MKNHHPIIMDCTLRDGSYSIDFQFNKKDTRTIVSKLSRARIPLIEVGHGVGLGASKNGYGASASSDEDYCEAASKGISNLQNGECFVFPGLPL